MGDQRPKQFNPVALKLYREKAALSARQLSINAGLRQNVVSDYERGIFAEYGANAVGKLAYALGVPVARLYK